jgi:hypothetical protein
VRDSNGGLAFLKITLRQIGTGYVTIYIYVFNAAEMYHSTSSREQYQKAI